MFAHSLTGTEMGDKTEILVPVHFANYGTVRLTAEFENAGSEADPTSRLFGTLYLFGVGHHVELLAVEIGDTEYQHAADGEFDSMYEDVYRAASADGPWQTIDIGGREYVAIITPHCA